MRRYERILLNDSVSLLKDNLEKTIRIPMGFDIRSLNLSNSVAIVAYEVEKQWNFSGLKETSEYLL